MSKRNNFFGSKSGLTARTIAFIAATGISDTTIVNALNTMDLSLIANGFDSKLEALYPLVGGTATTHKYNFMNAADTDAAYRIGWSGGITHNSNGITGNGSTGYGDTFFNPSTDGVIYQRNSASFGFYCRNNTAGLMCDFGGGDISGNPQTGSIRRRGGGNETLSVNNNEHYTGNNLASIQGFYSVSRTSSTTINEYLNGTNIFNYAALSQPLNVNSLTLMAINWSGTKFFYSSRNYALYFFGGGFTSGEMATLYTIIQAFQTSLSRNV